MNTLDSGRANAATLVHENCRLGSSNKGQKNTVYQEVESFSTKSYSARFLRVISLKFQRLCKIVDFCSAWTFLLTVNTLRRGLHVLRKTNSGISNRKIARNRALFQPNTTRRGSSLTKLLALNGGVFRVLLVKWENKQTIGGRKWS